MHVNTDWSHSCKKTAKSPTPLLQIAVLIALSLQVRVHRFRWTPAFSRMSAVRARGPREPLGDRARSGLAAPKLQVAAGARPLGR